ncbi:MAG: hypothetical protein LC781_06725 [Actinobacteria bacterium]|nr:hypothetical protein [Actinomycetota bacterium]
MRHPLAEGPSAHDTRHPADYQRPRQAEASLPRWRTQATQDPQRHTQRQAEAQQISDELGKVGTGGVEHAHRRGSAGAAH